MPTIRHVNDQSATKNKFILRMRDTKHGFSKCFLCKAKLVYYIIQNKATVEDIEGRLREKGYEDIANMRKYTQRVIRESLGMGLYDNYIVEYKLWNVRRPVMAAEKTLEELRKEVNIRFLTGAVIHVMNEKGRNPDATLLWLANLMKLVGHSPVIIMLDNVLKNAEKVEENLIL